MEHEFEAPDANGLNFEERKTYILSYITYLKSIECDYGTDESEFFMSEL